MVDAKSTGTSIDVGDVMRRLYRPTVTYITVGLGQAGLPMSGRRPAIQLLDIVVIDESLMTMLLMSRILSIGGALPQHGLI